MTASAPFVDEETPTGRQTLVPGVPAIRPCDWLTLHAIAPLRSIRPQKPADHGLFDLAARDQLDLFASVKRRQ